MPQSTVFGHTRPWADPAWYYGRPSPYYKESHYKFRDALRNWVLTNLVEPTDVKPNDAYKKCAAAGLLLPIGVGATIPKDLAHYPLFTGVKPEEWDGFHDFILWYELYREWPSLPSAVGGLVVGFPPLQRFGSQELRQRTIPEILAGKKRLCFAVTEPDAGSDLKNVNTTATKSTDGKHYIVNGEKKWITNGSNSHYFTALVRTGGPGFLGLSLLLIPLTEGVSTRAMQLGLDGQETTAYVTFENVNVPVSNLIGVEGDGFRYVVSNFNHERLLVGFQGLSMSRVCLLEAMEWAHKRQAFEKLLIEQPVVRWKFAQMGRQIESLHTWTEQILYEVQNMSYAEANRLVGGETALLKAHTGIVTKYVTDECQKLLGGLGMTKTGQGARIEANARRAMLLIIPGGAEDVMLDLGARQGLKVSKSYAQSHGGKL